MIAIVHSSDIIPLFAERERRHVLKEVMMDKVRFEISGPLGILTLANPPLNLFSGEVIEDLRAAVTTVKQSSLRALLVRAKGKIFSGGADVSVFAGRTAGEARERFTSHLQLIADLEELRFQPSSLYKDCVSRRG